MATVNVLADGATGPKSFPNVIALEESRETEFVVPPAPLKPAPAVSVAPEDTGGAAPSQDDQPARDKVVAESAQQERVRQEATRQEAESLASIKDLIKTEFLFLTRT